MLSAAQKKDVANTVRQAFSLADNDTGSTEVQIALLTRRIRDLTEHLKVHKKDNHTRYGLKKMVSQRRKLLSYLIRRNLENYLKLLQVLDIRDIRN